MRLGRRTKSNIFIAILLCMVFAVNVGSTFAFIDYDFWAKSAKGAIESGETAVKQDAFTDFASAQGSSAKYIYSPGISNNQLSISYGFKQNYDLMIKFTASYANTSYYQTTERTLEGGETELLTSRTHIANDFSLNFANRNDWLIDMGSKADITTGDPNPTYYTLTEDDSSTISGVMYYMGTLTGSKILPVITGVTFYTSPNNSYEFIGDELTITLEPEYVKSNSENYNTGHAFYTTSADAYGFVPNTTLFNNWATYMSEKDNGTVADNTSIMIYNAYVDEKRGLSFPYDESVMQITENDGKKSANIKADWTQQPTYSNTAHRYYVNEGIRTYDAITAGNKYYGGLGVYVIPSANLVTISVTINCFWIGGGTSTSGVVDYETSSDITTITSGTTDYYYYRENIDKPTYVNVLDYIKLTAETYSSLIAYGYKMVLNNIDVNPIYEKGTAGDDITTIDEVPNWSHSARPGYEVLNSTKTSPVLARISQVYVRPLEADAKIGITNTSSEAIGISSFKINTRLWYAKYITQGTGNTAVTVCSEELVQDTTKNPAENIYLTKTALKYQSDLWTVTDEGSGVVRFEANGGVTYIPAGYTLTLISGVEIPITKVTQTADSANDFWCDLDITNIETTTANYNVTSTSGVEVFVDGYYNTITKSNPGYIYIRNNTNQIITGVNLSNINVKYLDTNSELIDTLPRDKWLSTAEVTTTSNFDSTISIYPHQMVLAYEIKPTLDKQAIILNYNLEITLTSGLEAEPLDLWYNAHTQKSAIINNSTNSYEFRLVSTTDLSSILLSEDTGNGGDFLECEVGGVYYYYYKGIVCPDRHIEIFQGEFKANVYVDELLHNPTEDGSGYVVSNYTETWELDTNRNAEREWLEFMKSLYSEPSSTARENAVVVAKA